MRRQLSCLPLVHLIQINRLDSSSDIAGGGKLGLHLNLILQRANELILLHHGIFVLVDLALHQRLLARVEHHLLLLALFELLVFQFFHDVGSRCCLHRFYGQIAL